MGDDELIIEAQKKYKGLVPLVYDIETMGLAEARPEDMQYAVYLKREADKVIADLEESHKKEVEQLLIEIAELKEAQRWRKYSEEKPRSDGNYIICGSSGYRNADRFTECKDGRGMDFSFYSYGVKYWMPMPPVPEELTEKFKG